MLGDNSVAVVRERVRGGGVGSNLPLQGGQELLHLTEIDIPNRVVNDHQSVKAELFVPGRVTASVGPSQLWEPRLEPLPTLAVTAIRDDMDVIVTLETVSKVRESRFLATTMRRCSTCHPWGLGVVQPLSTRQHGERWLGGFRPSEDSPLGP